MAYRRGSVDRILVEEYDVIRVEDRPRYGTREWGKWLEEFAARHPLKVSRMTEPLAVRALKVLRNSIPDFD